MRGEDVFVNRAMWIGLLGHIDRLKRQRKRMQKNHRRTYMRLSGGLYVRKFNNVKRALCPCGKCYRVRSENCCRGDE